MEGFAIRPFLIETAEWSRWEGKGYGRLSNLGGEGEGRDDNKESVRLEAVDDAGGVRGKCEALASLGFLVCSRARRQRPDGTQKAGHCCIMSVDSVSGPAPARL